MTYQMDERVYVVDFPGSNSLDECSKTFSLCGAMNNMILVIISIKFISTGLPKKYTIEIRIQVRRNLLNVITENVIISLM